MHGIAICVAKVGILVPYRQQTKEERVPRSNGQDPGKEPHRARDRRVRDKERGRNPKRNSKIGIKETVKQV